ncbi:MAG: ribosome biogenesis GTPase YlqF [Clostridia bacterium]|nr:ribosome biogenesis GTPase YlqF [Clostridia bacterium]
MEHINWYPGHMKKTRELIAENLKLVDVVCELLDARIPVSSRNPIIDELVAHKKRIVIFNKSDLADPLVNNAWKQEFLNCGTDALFMNSVSGEGIAPLMRLLEKIRDERNSESLRKKPLRLMIVGVPNVGKSSLINRLTGKKSARTGNKPGITKGKQWLNLGIDIQLLDTPGILWPKFEDPNVGLNLAFCGAIKDEILDISTLGLELIKKLTELHYELLKNRYKLGDAKDTPLESMEEIAARRGFILSGNRTDYERVARTVLDEFRAGILGRVTLEFPNQP